MHKSSIKIRVIFFKLIPLGIVSLLISFTSYSQLYLDSLPNKIDLQKWSSLVKKKISKLEDKIITKSEKTLDHLQRQEEKIFRKQLETKDSLIAKTKIAEIKTKYAELKEKLKDPVSAISRNARQYLPYLDTLRIAFKFLDRQGLTNNIKGVLSGIESFESGMQHAEEIRKFIREREEHLKQQLEKLGMAKQIKKFNKEVYYYSEQIREYKEAAKNSKKIEKKAIELLSKTKPFQDFMQKNSMLAYLFRMPGDANDPTYIASLADLQTRSQINNIIQQQIATGGPDAQAQFQQNIQQAQTQLQQLKNKVNQFSGESIDDIMPEEFKPNNQKTKSFSKRLEYGANIQTQRSNNLLPVRSDLGLSLGYKLNDRSVIGIGASYKLGWGRSSNNINLTQEGAGLRSYVDWKLKGSFWISGGYEMNYKTAFNSIDQLHLNAWQESGLLGLSKILSVRTKFLKKTKLQLLWDFMSYQQIPKTQPLIFRMGYNFK